MKKFIPLLLAVFAVTLASCEKDPDMDKLDNNYLVYTNYDKKADFKTFETYYLPDSILVIGDKENAEYWKRKITGNKDRCAKQQDQLSAMGWEILVIWECQLKNHETVSERIMEFLKNYPET